MGKLGSTLNNYGIIWESQVASEENAITHGCNNIIGSRVIMGRNVWLDHGTYVLG